MPIAEQCRYLDPDVAEDMYGDAHITLENEVPTLKEGKAPNVQVGVDHHRCTAVPGVGIPRVEDGVGIAHEYVIEGFCRGFHDRCPLAQAAHADDGTGYSDHTAILKISRLLQTAASRGSSSR